MKKNLRKTKIVGTIGPASENILKELFEEGLNVCRINYSHGSYEDQEFKTNEIIRLREEMDLPIPIILDLQGPEIRIGKLYCDTTEKLEIKDGQQFVLVNDDIIGDETKASITYKDLYKDIKPGAKVLIDDGELELVVDEIKDKDIYCTVVHGNMLGSRKTVSVPGTEVHLPTLKQKDIDDLKAACEHDYDFIAISFTRNVDDIKAVRKVLDENGGQDIQIIAKIENIEGISNIDNIISEADAQMIARGDMAIETDITTPPIMQKKIIKDCNTVYKQTITATQMLESMTYNPVPTRAEASDVANAVYDRTSAVMLSGECSLGKYPVECVKTMDKILTTVENDINYWKRFESNSNITLDSLDNNIGYSTCVIAKNINADALVCYTYTGDSPKRLSGMGAACPIFAITDNKRVYRQLNLVWNVYPIYVKRSEDVATIDDIVDEGLEILKQKGYLESGDKVIMVGGHDYTEELKNSKVIGGYVEI